MREDDGQMTTQAAWGLLLLRMAMGFGFAFHGFAKFKGGIENTSNWFDSLGIPGIFAYGVALLEVMGGFALIAGVATKLVALLLAIVMTVAIWKVKFANGYLSYELETMYLAASIALALNGSGRFSIDQTLFPKKLKPNEQMTTVE
jgi:uncharacterized membrane protein YphA (DoxX/SURF4 family)